MYRYQYIASMVCALRTCENNERAEWHKQTLDEAMEGAPSGSGIDNGMQLMLAASTRQKLVFRCEYHHMNEGGFYDGWTGHEIKVTPGWRGPNIVIGGRNRNDVKDYLYDVIECWLMEKL